MGALTLIVTGAGGFLGRAVITAALARGHKVHAVVRRPGNLPEKVREVTCDLAKDEGLGKKLAGGDVVLHLAASITGDDALHERDTLAATRALYAALPAGMPVILAGSMAVYQGRAGIIDETSPLEPAPEQRDAYARAKLAQEQIVRAHPQNPTTILRIGALTGAGREWNAHLGLELGPFFLSLGGAGTLPLVGVADAAEALVLAAEAAPSLDILNIIGDNLPISREYLTQIRQSSPVIIPCPWHALLPFATLSQALRLPVPGLLRPATLRYRFARRTYPNVRAKAALGWVPRGWEGHQ